MPASRCSPCSPRSPMAAAAAAEPVPAVPPARPPQPQPRCGPRCNPPVQSPISLLHQAPQKRGSLGRIRARARDQAGSVKPGVFLRGQEGAAPPWPRVIAPCTPSGTLRSPQSQRGHPGFSPGTPGVTFAAPHGPRLAATQGPRQPPAPGTVLHAPSSRFMPARRHLISGNIMKLKRAGGDACRRDGRTPQPQRGSRAAFLPAPPQAETQTYCRA